MVAKNIKNTKELWGKDSLPDISAVFHSCLTWASTPGWAFIYRSIVDNFGIFKGLRTIELGCGEGKISLLFSLLGSNTTLVDYSEKQLKGAKYIAEKFKTKPIIIKEDILQLPESLMGQYDVAMSFGTAEHFLGDNRQRIFDIHSNILKQGGLAIIWVPNRYAFLFHFGGKVRKLLHRSVITVKEISFSRKELLKRAHSAGLSEVKIRGGELLRNDFCHFIVDFPRILGFSKMHEPFTDPKSAREKLLKCIESNNARIKPWNNLLSYPLVLIARK